MRNLARQSRVFWAIGRTIIAWAVFAALLFVLYIPVLVPAVNPLGPYIAMVPILKKFSISSLKIR